MKISIIGATGHVGRALTHYFRLYGHTVTAFARVGGRDIAPLSLFPGEVPDILINCIGVGTPQKEEKIGDSLFDIEDEWDNRCLGVVRQYPTVTYFYFSSGIADPRFKSDSWYAVAKRTIEEKHRGMKRVYDIRLYSFFTRFVSLENNQFIPSIVTAIKSKTPLKVDKQMIWRSYIHPEDLMAIIYDTWAMRPEQNIVEAISGPPVTKSRIISWFTDVYGLKVKWRDGGEDPKPRYFPNSVNYQMRDSFTTVCMEACYLLGGYKNVI